MVPFYGHRIEFPADIIEAVHSEATPARREAKEHVKETCRFEPLQSDVIDIDFIRKYRYPLGLGNVAIISLFEHIARPLYARVLTARFGPTRH